MKLVARRIVILSSIIYFRLCAMFSKMDISETYSLQCTFCIQDNPFNEQTVISSQKPSRHIY